MGRKIHRNGRRGRRSLLLGSAVIPASAGAAAVALLAGRAVAAPTVTFVSLGVANGGGSIGAQPGWHAFRMVVTADTGDVFTGMDISTFGRGLFGDFLQRWTYNSSGDVRTPTGTQQNNGVNVGSLDTHIITLASQSYVMPGGAPLNEDNDKINPGLSVPNTATVNYGTGSALNGAFAVAGVTSLLVTQPLAYIVLKDGTIGSGFFDLAECQAGGGPNSGFTFHMTFSAAPDNKIASLTAVSAGTPTTYGNKLTQGTSGVDKASFDNGGSSDSTIHLLGSGALGYRPGHATNINGGAGEQKFYVQSTGWNPAGDEEIFALNIKVNGADPTAAQDSAIINDINANNTGVFASTVSGQYLGVFPGYDILLTAGPSSNNSPSYLAIDFSADTVTTGVMVTDVAAVPEPAAIATLLLLSSASLLLGRRRRPRGGVLE
jgi:hypothetical protein